MKTCLITICDTEIMAQSIDLYFRNFLASKIESYFMTYKHRVLSGRLFHQADVFVLDLFGHDDLGYRAEGLIIAEKWIKAGKKVLVVSGAAKASIVDITWYWDLGAKDLLHDRLATIIQLPVPEPEIFKPLRKIFHVYCRKPVSKHHSYR